MATPRKENKQMKRRLKKVNGTLVGFDSEAEEALKRLPVDTLLYYDITNPRNSKFHKKLFAMLSIIKDNYHEKVSVEEILVHIKDKLNMWDVAKIGDTHYKRYESISFDKMDEDSFAEFYDKAVDVCMLLVPIDMDDLAVQVAKFGSR